MNNSVLFHRFICGIAALLVSGGATAEGVRLSEWRHHAPLHDFSAGQSLSQTVVTNNQELGLFQHGFAGDSDESDERFVAALFFSSAALAAVVGGAVAIAVSNDDDEAVATTDPDMGGGDGDGEVSVAVMCGDDAMPTKRIFTEPDGEFRFLNFASEDFNGPPVALTNSIVNWGVLTGDINWAISISDDEGHYIDGRGLPAKVYTDVLSKGTIIYLHDFPGGTSVRRLTLYTYEDSQMTLFAAAGSLNTVGGDAREKKCTLEAGEFFLTADNVRTTEYATTNQFRERLRGVLSEGTAVRLGNFYFAGDEKFSNIKLERRDDLWLSEEFDVYSALGYQKIADDNTAVFYNQLTALRHLSADTDGYLQISSGSVTSDKLRGLAVGFIADKVLSHDNILHFRLERPLGDARAKSWYAAVDVQMGNAAKYWSFSLRHNLDTAQIEGGIYYQREF